MLIGFDARAIFGRKTGDTSYAVGLFAALRELLEPDRLVGYLRTPPPHSEAGLRVLPAGSDKLWTLISLPWALKRDGVTCAHVQYICPRCPCPLVTAIHDISFVPHPEWFPKKDVMLMKMFLPKTISIACKVLVPSQSTKTDLIDFWNVPEEKIEVIYLSGGEEMGSRPREGARERLAAKHGIKPPFVFAVGPLQPRKNHLRLFEAMRLVRKSMPEASLVVAGSYRWGGGRFQQDLLNASQQCDAKLVGYVENDDLADFYTACDCFCYPSLYEGFGIPILEAMRCATPVVCSNKTSLPEVAGDAALFVDPLSVDQIADALLEVLSNSDLKCRLAEAGKARAAAFSWQETARRTVKVYQEVGA